MVYYSDFYTTRRPYSTPSPSVTSYSVTAGYDYQHSKAQSAYSSSSTIATNPRLIPAVGKAHTYHPSIPLIAHKKMTNVTTPVPHNEVRKTVIYNTIDRIHHKPRSYQSYDPMEDFLNERSTTSFEDVSRSIRANTAALLKKVNTPIPRAIRPLSVSNEYNHIETPISERISSDEYIWHLLRPLPGRQHNGIDVGYYPETSTHVPLGKTHLACLSYAGNHPISKRRQLLVAGPGDDYRNVRNDVELLSHYSRMRKAASVPREHGNVSAGTRNGDVGSYKSHTAHTPYTTEKVLANGSASYDEVPYEKPNLRRKSTLDEDTSAEERRHDEEMREKEERQAEKERRRRQQEEEERQAEEELKAKERRRRQAEEEERRRREEEEEEERRLAEEERKAEARRKAEEERYAEERRREEERLAEEKRREEERLAEEAEFERLAEEERQAEARAEQERLAEEKRLEEERLAEEARRAEEERFLEEERLAEEKRREEERLAEEAEFERIAQEEAESEEQKRLEEKLIEEYHREQERLAAEERDYAEQQQRLTQEKLAEEQKLLHDKLLKVQQEQEQEDTEEENDWVPQEYVRCNNIPKGGVQESTEAESEDEVAIAENLKNSDGSHTMKIESHYRKRVSIKSFSIKDDEDNEQEDQKTDANSEISENEDGVEIKELEDDDDNAEVEGESEEEEEEDE